MNKWWDMRKWVASPVVIVVALLVVGCGKRPSLAIFPPETPEEIRRGAQVYSATCVACHLAPEQGNPPQVPALTTSQVVKGDSPELVRAIMFNPAHRDPSNGLYLFTVLPDSDIAAVANHLRRPVLGGAIPVQERVVARERADPPK